ncbi:STAS/SEC14 domain-containing protein [Proteobacteria bacterium 005FR1]|nr:STAS/SEC14 domain-containing protein [Proteobacteria bacterium 005FR1]
MITVEVDPSTNVAILKPQGMLNESDFETIKGIVDPFIDEKGRLDGVILQARRFPGWESFQRLSDHLRFSQDQQEKVTRVAVVSDSALPRVKQVLGEHFTHAEVETFAFQDYEKARRWVSEPSRH